jgi:hypothetical protein
MGLFTLVLDYRGGTYVSQATCGTLGELMYVLAQAINWNALENHVSEREKSWFLEDLAEIPPSPIDGLKNVWCNSARLGEFMAILHIVETTEKESAVGISSGERDHEP